MATGPTRGAHWGVHQVERRWSTGYVLAVALLGHLVLISAQVDGGSSSTVPERLVYGTFAEMQRAVTLARDAADSVWQRVVAVDALRARHDALATEVADLKLRLQAQRAQAQRANRLEVLLDLEQDLDLDTVSARVIAGSAVPYFRTFTIDRGSTDTVAADAAVLAPGGVVGRVFGEPAGRASHVQLLNDRNAAAGARIERTRAAGIVYGTDDASLLRLEMEPGGGVESVRIGDRVVTSGLEGIYPAGYVIGDVSAVRREPGLLVEVAVEPAVDFARLETVLVVRSQPRRVDVVAGNE